MMDSTMQRLVILVGLPGSGKTTLAKKLIATGWVWVNQDALGDRRACEESCAQALSRGHDVVVDRCNFNALQRSNWLKLCREVKGEGGVLSIAAFLDVPAEVCIQRVQRREDHPTLNGSSGKDVISSFASDFEVPKASEGFDRLVTLTNDESIDLFVTEVGPAGCGMLPISNATHKRRPSRWDVPSVEPVDPARTTTFWHPPSVHPQHYYDSHSGGQTQWPPGPAHQYFAPAKMPSQNYGWDQPSYDVLQSWRRPEYGEPQGFNRNGEDAYRSGRRKYDPLRQHRGSPEFRLQNAGHFERSYSPVYDNSRTVHRDRFAPPPAESSTTATASMSTGFFPCSRSDPTVGSDIPAEPFPAKNNAVPFHKRKNGRQEHWRNAKGPGQPHDYKDLDDDPRPILLFDLNGTLTSHTSKRRSAGRNRMRPGTTELRKLSEKFRLGVFTSSTFRTVQTAVGMLEDAAGEGPKVFDSRLILYRDHTWEAPAHHKDNGGKPWDTIKPLHPYFKKLHRVLLVDDDGYKAISGEEDHMVLMPCWEDEDPEDTVIHCLVAALLEVMGDLPADEDLTQHSQKLTKLLWSKAGRMMPQREPVSSPGGTLSAALDPAAAESEGMMEAAAAQQLPAVHTEPVVVAQS